MLKFIHKFKNIILNLKSWEIFRKMMKNRKTRGSYQKLDMGAEISILFEVISSKLQYLSLNQTTHSKGVIPHWKSDRTTKRHTIKCALQQHTFTVLIFLRELCPFCKTLHTVSVEKAIISCYWFDGGVKGRNNLFHLKCPLDIPF